MATITTNTTVEASWSSTDKLRLYVGSENAANLAASDPVGGSLVVEQAIDQADTGDLVEMVHTLRPSDKCATLPIGISIADAAGNESAKTESVIQLADPPDATGKPDVAATASAGEAKLSWTASPDV